MADTEVENWLQAGITAVKNSDQAQARLLFLKVVEADEDNESGWLWLSQVVEDEADKRACLENVLSINPQNGAARRMLAHLDHSDTAVPLMATSQPQIEYQQDEKFDDVWSRNVPLCGYCAGQIAPEDSRCPACGRHLYVQIYRYAIPSSSLVLYWFTLTAVAVTYGAQIGYSALTLQTFWPVITGAAMMILLLVTAVFLYFRQYWANIFAITMLAVIMLIGIAQLLINPDLSMLGFDTLDPAIRGVVEPLTSGAWKAIKGTQVAMAALTLLFAFRAAPDFDRVHYRQEAAVAKGLRHASEYHGAAQRMAQVGLWATAVLHWQRAVALEPTRITYQRYLGNAYARLGFYERSLDVLQAAQRLASHPESQAEISGLIQNIKQRAQTAASPKSPATS
jgi:tetratricopeptide (TPR) repeat protein